VFALISLARTRDPDDDVENCWWTELKVWLGSAEFNKQQEVQKTAAFGTPEVATPFFQESKSMNSSSRPR
jgi:hypothetical protein